MRIAVSVLALVAMCGLAGAAENYIPRGHSYTPDSPFLPDANSAEDLLNQRVDVYEAQIYIKQREQKIWESQQNRFRFAQELDGGNFNPEY
jgi:hypothetical protein